MKLTDRQIRILSNIVEEFIETGIPVGSKHLLESSDMNVSSATIRAEMSKLEKQGYLEKAHTSSGRVPSTMGFQFYADNLATKQNKNIERKLNDIFAKRRVSIDLTLDEAAKSISEMAGLTLVTTSSENDELLKSIQLTPLSDAAATIVLVTSSGRVESKLIEFNGVVKIQDVRIAIRLFKERLIDTPLKDLPTKVDALSPILSESVKNYEELIQVFVGKVFDYHNKVQSKVYGNSSLIKSQEIKREDIANLLTMMQTTSIFESIEGKLDEDENMKIDVRSNNTSIISKKIETESGSKEVSIVGSNRMQYSDVKTIMQFLEKYLKGGNNE